jgi:hypothetical protein
MVVVVALDCPIGWGGSASLQTIQESQIDDGYCDCPTTGEDEPNTEACAGREHWGSIAK